MTVIVNVFNMVFLSKYVVWIIVKFETQRLLILCVGTGISVASTAPRGAMRSQVGVCVSAAQSPA